MKRRTARLSLLITRTGFLRICGAYGVDVEPPQYFDRTNSVLAYRIGEIEDKITMLTVLLKSTNKRLDTDTKRLLNVAKIVSNEIRESVESIENYIANS